MSAMSDERVPRERVPHESEPRDGGGPEEAPEATSTSEPEPAGCGSAQLDAAVHALRETVPVRPSWREALLREVAAEPAPRRARWVATPWTVTPARAAAAALLCAALGAAGTYAALRRPGSPTAPASLAPSPGAGGAGAAATPAADVRGATTVRFTIAAAGASRVSVVGDFNGWDPAATPLRRVGADGTWEATVPLSPGRHVYAFVVDGGLTTDPAAPRAPDDDFGAPNSVLLVGGPRT
jgi:hypothetical protein